MVLLWFIISVVLTASVIIGITTDDAGALFGCIALFAFCFIVPIFFEFNPSVDRLTDEQVAAHVKTIKNDKVVIFIVDDTDVRTFYTIDYYTAKKYYFYRVKTTNGYGCSSSHIAIRIEPFPIDKR